jgi:hypothetical protein
MSNACHTDNHTNCERRNRNHTSAVMRTPPTQPQSSVPQQESTTKTLLCTSLVIMKYTTPALDGCGRTARRRETCAHLQPNETECTNLVLIHTRRLARTVRLW